MNGIKYVGRNIMTKEDLLKSIDHYNTRTGMSLEKTRAALIDMDGTLYDSMPWHAFAWHKMMSEIGVQTNQDEFFGYEGMTGKATINLLFQRAFGRDASDCEATELYRIKSRYFVENNHADIMPGAPAVVEELRSRNISAILVTGSGQTSLLSRLETDFSGAFPEAKRITASNVKKGKPSPEPYLKGLELAEVSANQAIVIENAPLGVMSGVNAEIFTIAVCTGPIPLESFYEAGADLVFKSMPECAEMLPQLLDIISK